MGKEKLFSWATLTSSEVDILEAIFWRRLTTRAALPCATGFSQSKVNAAVASLLLLQFLEETGIHLSTGGRKPSLLRLSSALGVLVAIDLSSTSLDLALMTPELQSLARYRETTSVCDGPAPVMAQIKKILKKLLLTKHIPIEQILAIGMGVPGPVEFSTGLPAHPSIMPGWEGYPIRDILRSEFGAPVYVDTNANAMALGELWHRPGDDRNLIVVKVGTGIGAGIICHGRLYRGTDGAAGEIGHICVAPRGPMCYCGNRGCLVSVASGPAIERMANEAARKGESPALSRILQRTGRLTLPDVSLISLDGDPTASVILHRAGQYLGQTLASLVSFFNPSHLLIGGGTAKSGPLLLAAIRQSVYQFSHPLSTRHLEMNYTSLGDEASVIGAAVLAMIETLRDAREGATLTSDPSKVGSLTSA